MEEKASVATIPEFEVKGLSMHYFNENECMIVSTLFMDVLIHLAYNGKHTKPVAHTCTDDNIGVLNQLFERGRLLGAFSDARLENQQLEH